MNERDRALIAEMEEEIANQRAATNKNEAEWARIIGWEDALDMVKRHLGADSS